MLSTVDLDRLAELIDRMAHDLELGQAPEETLPTFIIGDRSQHVFFARFVDREHDARGYVALAWYGPELLRLARLGLTQQERGKCGPLVESSS